ncbi:hypothetical protein FQA39_LY01106 [Lamprigera yunnana]|nr:hypothetical protein FQA39_LY01106 [Lamprigera yunnana]
MADDSGFDPYECVWSHDMAMRRLLSLLRQSQSYCTDNECFQSVVGSQNQAADNFLFVTLLFAFALLMYYLRPNSQNNSIEAPTKPHNNNDSNPPTPPTVS